MFAFVGSHEPQRSGFSAIALCFLLLAAAAEPAVAAGCSLAPQGEGRVTAVIDARTLRLDDGRDVSLVGVEPATPGGAGESRTAALSAIATGRDVTLHGDDDTPDRYGRQPAFVFLAGAAVQSELLRRGEAWFTADVADKDCAGTLAAAEAEAIRAKIGIWSVPTAIKNAESPGDILAGIGRFTVVEGKVLSVRQAGSVTYLNFGRNWTQDFAATISRRMIPAFETAGLSPKSMENRRIRVRGFVSSRGGPRIEVVRVGQIEVLGGK